MYVLAAMMAANVALAAPEPASTAPAPQPASTAPTPAPAAQPAAAVIPDNWAVAPPADKTLVRRAIQQTFEDEKEIAIAESKQKAIPRRYTASSHTEQDKYEKFADQFDEAKVPGCLRPDALKHQPTFIFGGLLALPFIAVAAIRGKCN
ncbi:hypothetical protein [Massilia sp. TSP1-1-2]